MKQNQKLCRKMKKVINTGKSRKTLSGKASQKLK